MLNKLTIQYQGDKSSSNCKDDTSDCKITVPANANTTVTIDAKGNNLQIGSDGKGTLHVDTGKNGGDKKLQFVLKAGGGENTTAFKVNLDLNIGGGSGDANGSAGVDLQFNGNVKGDISIKYNKQKNPKGITNTLVFKGKQGLEGDLYTQNGTHNSPLLKGE